MDDVEFRTRKLRDAEAELDAAKTRTALDAAAKRLQRARAAVKALEAEKAERATRRASRGALPQVDRPGKRWWLNSGW
jgi:hypothetical protein